MAKTNLTKTDTSTSLPLPPRSLLDSIPTLNAADFKALPEKERLKIHDDLLEVLLYSHAKDMATDKVFLRKKLDRNDVVSYGILRDKRLQQAQSAGAGFKAPQFFINSLQIAILQQPATTISSDRVILDSSKIMETASNNNKDIELENQRHITDKMVTLNESPTNLVGNNGEAGGG